MDARSSTLPGYLDLRATLGGLYARLCDRPTAERAAEFWYDLDGHKLGLAGDGRPPGGAFIATEAVARACATAGNPSMCAMLRGSTGMCPGAPDPETRKACVALSAYPTSIEEEGAPPLPPITVLLAGKPYQVAAECADMLANLATSPDIQGDSLRARLRRELMLDQIRTSVLGQPEAAIGRIHCDPTDGAVGDIEQDAGAGPVAVELNYVTRHIVHAIVIKAVRSAIVHLIAVVVRVRAACERDACQIEPAARHAGNIAIGSDIAVRGDTNVHGISSGKGVEGISLNQIQADGRPPAELAVVHQIKRAGRPRGSGGGGGTDHAENQEERESHKPEPKKKGRLAGPIEKLHGLVIPSLRAKSILNHERKQERSKGTADSFKQLQETRQRVPILSG